MNYYQNIITVRLSVLNLIILVLDTFRYRDSENVFKGKILLKLYVKELREQNLYPEELEADYQYLKWYRNLLPVSLFVGISVGSIFNTLFLSRNTSKFLKYFCVLASISYFVQIYKLKYEKHKQLLEIKFYPYANKHVQRYYMTKDHRYLLNIKSDELI